MIIKIVCNGEDSFSKLYSHDDNEFIIGVDGGCKVLIDNNVDIDLAMGDFDSFPLEEARKYTKHILVLRKDKDKSDLDMVLDQVHTLYDVTKIIIYNATGGRLDHYHGIINALCKEEKYPIEVVNATNYITTFYGEKEFVNDGYKYFSFFALEDNTIITIVDFKYQIQSHTLNRFDNLCLSNELENKGVVRTNKKIIMYKSK
ncbi:MAG: thiamine diphosphokinase [Bacilli bacterium]|nr:thiamine diphosphokinase [Bacilli bacterium]